MAALRCHCGNWLGVLVAGAVESRHRGRRYLVRDGVLICEHCEAETVVKDGRLVASLALVG